MGKASSAKKIARAARAGATSGPNERRELGFPALVAAVVIGGLLLVGFARATRDAQASPTLQDHWHSAYALFDCVGDSFLAPFESQFDPQGIHSHTDSLIHIHPFSAEVTGKGAKMGRFLEAMGATVEADAITLPGGETLEAGVDCGGTPSVIAVGEWTNGLEPEGEPDVIYTEDFGNIVFDAQNKAYTIARIADPSTLMPPPADVIEALAATQGLSRDEGIEPPNTSARPGPQDFGTGSGPAETATADDTSTAVDTATVDDSATDSDSVTAEETASDG
jgi:hypothetical protein